VQVLGQGEVPGVVKGEVQMEGHALTVLEVAQVKGQVQEQV